MVWRAVALAGAVYTPVDALMDPALPGASDQEYGPVPPLAVKVTEVPTGTGGAAGDMAICPAHRFARKSAIVMCI